ncbi:MAG: hypothetical protein ACRDWA_17580 [Acidimicrobiia bacterium]
MSKTRAARVEALEEWASKVDSADPQLADTTALREIAKLADQRNEVEAELAAAVRSARQARRSWSEIGALLGVPKQAAQRKYASKAEL